LFKNQILKGCLNENPTTQNIIQEKNLPPDERIFLGAMELLADNDKIMKTLKEMFDFAEWASFHYVRLHGVWVHKYKNQSDPSNHRSTKEIYDFYRLVKKYDSIVKKFA